MTGLKPICRIAYLTDSIGPRMAGSPQADAAIEYVAAELRRLGLEVTLEKIQIPRWTRGEERAELVSYPGQTGAVTQRVAVTSLVAPGIETPPDGITADLVVVS